jgi:hypothetical protein
MRTFLLSVLLAMPLMLFAQISGVVVDASDGYPIPYATVQYKGNRVSAIANGEGRFRIDRHNGWRLTISSVGYREQVINVGPQTPAQMTIRLAADNQTLKSDGKVEEEFALPSQGQSCRRTDAQGDCQQEEGRLEAS